MAFLTRRELQDRALRGSLWTLVSFGATLPLSIVANAVTARILGPTEYGHLAFLLAAFSIALPITEFGFGQALAQWGVSSEMKADAATTDSLLRSRNGFSLGVQLPLLWAGGLFLLRAEPGWVQAVFLMTTLVLVAGGGAQAALLIQNRTEAMAKITMLVGIAIQFGIVLAAVETEDASGVWSARLVLSALAPVFAAAILSRRLRRVAFLPRLPRGLPSGFWRFALLSWVAGASALLVYSRSEIFVLRLYDQAVELGLFAVAYGLSQQLTLPLVSLLAPLFPAGAGLTAAHPEHVREGFLRATRYFALVSGGLLSLVPAVFLVTPIAFGEDFSRSAVLFVPLAVASTLQAAASPFTILAFARRRGGVLVGAFVGALAVDVAAAVVLVAFYGAWGAVVANILGQLTSIAVLARRELAAQGTPTKEVVHNLRPWALGVVALGPGFAIGGIVQATFTPLAAVVAAAIAGVAVFGVLLRVTGGILTTADAGALLGLVPRRLAGLGLLVLRPALRSEAAE